MKHKFMAGCLITLFSSGVSLADDSQPGLYGYSRLSPSEKTVVHTNTASEDGHNITLTNWGFYKLGYKVKIVGQKYPQHGALHRGEGASLQNVEKDSILDIDIILSGQPNRKIKVDHSGSIVCIGTTFDPPCYYED